MKDTKDTGQERVTRTQTNGVVTTFPDDSEAKIRNIRNIRVAPQAAGNNLADLHIPYPLTALPGFVNEAVMALVDVVAAPDELAVQASLASISEAYGFFADVNHAVIRTRVPLTLWQLSSALSGDRKTTIAGLARTGIDRAVHQFKTKHPVMANIVTRVSDLTPEGLITALEASPGCALANSDAAAVLKGYAFSKEKAAQTGSVLADIWSGSSVSQVRAGNAGADSRFVQDPRLVIDMATQERFLAEFVSSPLYAQQGLTARFLFYTTISKQGTRFISEEETIDKTKSQGVLAKWNDKLQRDHLTLLERWGHDPDHRLTVGNSAEAIKVFVAAANNIEGQCGVGGRFRGDAYAQRFLEHAQRLAGLFACYRDTTDLTNVVVDADDAAAGVAIATHHLEVNQALKEVSVTSALHLEALTLYNETRHLKPWSTKTVGQVKNKYRGKALRVKELFIYLEAQEMVKVPDGKRDSAGRPTEVIDLNPD